MKRLLLDQQILRQKICILINTEIATGNLLLWLTAPPSKSKKIDKPLSYILEKLEWYIMNEEGLYKYFLTHFPSLDPGTDEEEVIHFFYGLVDELKSTVGFER